MNFIQLIDYTWSSQERKLITNYFELKLLKGLGITNYVFTWLNGVNLLVCKLCMHLNITRTHTLLENVYPFEQGKLQFDPLILT